MKRVVFDTNVLTSAFLFGGTPGDAFDSAREKGCQLLTSEALIAELADVLSRSKFYARLEYLGKSANNLLDGYRELAEVVETFPVVRVVPNDPDDDAVVACATAGKADYIISGDKHLKSLGKYQNIEIMPAAQFLTDVLEQL